MTGTARVAPPPPVSWVPVTAVRRAVGRRGVVWSRAPEFDPDGLSERYDPVRVVDNPAPDLDGQLYVPVVAECEWYRWLDSDPLSRPARCPHARAVLAEVVWLEE